MSHIEVTTKRGIVGFGDVWVVRKQDGTKATLYMGNTQDDFFGVTQILPSLVPAYAFTRKDFEACSSVKRLMTLWHEQFTKLVDLLRTRNIVDALEREHNNF